MDTETRARLLALADIEKPGTMMDLAIGINVCLAALDTAVKERDEALRMYEAAVVMAKGDIDERMAAEAQVSALRDLLQQALESQFEDEWALSKELRVAIIAALSSAPASVSARGAVIVAARADIARWHAHFFNRSDEENTGTWKALVDAVDALERTEAGCGTIPTQAGEP